MSTSATDMLLEDHKKAVRKAQRAAKRAAAATAVQVVATAPLPAAPAAPAPASVAAPAPAAEAAAGSKRPRAPRKSCTLILTRRRDTKGDYMQPQIWQLTDEDADAVAASVPCGQQEIISNSAMEFARGVVWEKGTGSFKLASELYASYKATCAAAGRVPLSNYAFSRALHHTARCVPAKVGGARGWRCILAAAEPDAASADEEEEEEEQEDGQSEFSV